MAINVKPMCSTTLTTLSSYFIIRSIHGHFVWGRPLSPVTVYVVLLILYVNVQLRSQCIERYIALHLLRLLHFGVVHNHRIALYVPWLSCLQKIHSKRWHMWFVLPCLQALVRLNVAGVARKEKDWQYQGGTHDLLEEVQKVHCPGIRWWS